MKRYDISSTSRRVSVPSFALSVSGEEVEIAEQSNLDRLSEKCHRLGFKKIYVKIGEKQTTEEEALEAFQRALGNLGISVVAIFLANRSAATDCYPACFGQLSAQERLEAAIRSLSSRFDEIVIDDFITCECECGECRIRKGRRSWADYRRSLMLGVAQERVAGPARNVRSNVKLGLMHPLPSRKMAVAPHFQVFDRIYLGSCVPGAADFSGPFDEAETRKSSDIDGIAAPIFFEWFAEIGGKKVQGALLQTDSLNLLQSAVEMTLAGASELIIPFESLPSNENENQKLSEGLSWLTQLGQAARKTPVRGVALYFPPGCEMNAEEIRIEALRDAGIPLRPTPRFPLSSRSAIFLSEALWDTILPAKIEESLRRGGRVAVSTSLSERSSDFQGLAESSESLGVIPAGFSQPENGVEASRIRNWLLEPLGVSLDAPMGLALSLFGTKDAVLHNRTGETLNGRLELSGRSLRVIAAFPTFIEAGNPLPEALSLPPRSWIWVSSV